MLLYLQVILHELHHANTELLITPSLATSSKKMCDVCGPYIMAIVMNAESDTVSVAAEISSWKGSAKCRTHSL